MRSKSQIKAILQEINHHPIKKFGQNFLVDKNLITKAAQWASPTPDCPLVEIGPGLGSITLALTSSQAPIYAVERDPKLAAYLQSLTIPNLHVLHADAVEHPIAHLNLAVHPTYSVISNLPFTITSPWLDALLNLPQLPQTMVLILQREAAEKLFEAQPGSNYSPLTLYLQDVFNLENALTISKECFFPAPQVESKLLHLSLKPHPYRYSLVTQALLRDVFCYQRKQLASSLKKYLQTHPTIADWLPSLPNGPQTRPSQVPFNAWKSLDALLRE